MVPTTEMLEAGASKYTGPTLKKKSLEKIKAGPLTEVWKQTVKKNFGTFMLSSTSSR